MAEHIIISGILTIILAQSLKLIINLLQKKPIKLNIFDNGEMPSSHSATVSSLCTAIIFETGFSPLFAATVMMSSIVIRDALSLRKRVGEHSKVLNEHLRTELKENVGHKRSQVIAGIIVGILFTVAYYSYVFY